VKWRLNEVIIPIIMSFLGICLTVLATGLGIKDFIIDQKPIQNGWKEVFLVILIIVALSTGIYSGVQSLSLLQGSGSLISTPTIQGNSDHVLNVKVKLIFEGLVVGYLSTFLYAYIRKKKSVV